MTMRIKRMQVMTVLSLTLLHIVPLVSLTYLNYAIFCAIRLYPLFQKNVIKPKNCAKTVYEDDI